MKDYDTCNDGSAYDLSAHRLKNFNVMLIIEHCSTQEGQTNFMKDMDKITKFVLIGPEDNKKNKHEARKCY